MDHLTRERRSANIAEIRSKNTTPELAIRSLLRGAGATGYRLHSKDLPGKPEIAFTCWKVALFVDGAFWRGRPDRVSPNATP